EAGVDGGGVHLLRVDWGDRVEETEDAYGFGALLDEAWLGRLSAGDGEACRAALGAHPMRLGEVEGVRFAVWAPNARRVSVVGDFNGWDGRRHPMRLRHRAGVWEIFLPRVRAGALYKYEITGLDGARLPHKADPCARQCELPPSPASRGADPAPFRWNDEEWMASAGRPARQVRVHRAGRGTPAAQGRPLRTPVRPAAVHRIAGGRSRAVRLERRGMDGLAWLGRQAAFDLRGACRLLATRCRRARAGL